MEVYTVQEVSDKLYVSKNTVYELLRRGTLKSFRVGKQYRISHSELEVFMEKYPNLKEMTPSIRLKKDPLPKVTAYRPGLIPLSRKSIKNFIRNLVIKS